MALVAWVIVESIMLFEEGLPAKDQDILELLQDSNVTFKVEQRWDDHFRLSANKYNAPDINQTRYSILFPYYINDVGVVPIWYKSAKVLDQMFKEQIAKSNYKVTKRDKLGLNKQK
jgi:hypothetical protein